MRFKMVHNLDEIIDLFIKEYDTYVNNMFNINIPNNFLCKLKEMNSIFGQIQVENILSILNYILDENKQDKSEQIKKTHLNKCTKWCKKYNLPIYENYNYI